MSSITVRFHKDMELASGMVSEDYLAKHIRKRPLYSKIPSRPALTESPFGPFPRQYKRTDYYDGNVHDRLKRVIPRKLPPEVFKGRAKVVRVHGEARPGTAPLSVKGDSTGVLRTKLNAINQRPSSAHPNAIREPQTHAHASEAPRPKSAPAGRKAEVHKVSVLQRVQTYMKHQGRFAVPPSQMLAEFADNKFRKGIKVLPRDTTVPPAGAFSVRPLRATLFRQYYDRADLPISMLHRAGGNRLKWHMKPQELDYHAYLPLFFDGLCEIDDPYRFMAMQGILDMVEASPSKILPCVPQIVLPLKSALDTREPTIMCGALKVLQHLILADPQVGQALVPYYRQLLPTFNLFKNKNQNRGDGIDYNQRRRLCVGDLIAETLELLELTGGPDAYINLKWMIPTYESSLVF